MALTAATRATEGFEPIGNKVLQFVPPPVDYELTPNTAFSKGDLVILTNGLVAKAAAGATNVLGAMAEAITTAVNTATSRTLGKVYDNPFNIYRCTFSDQYDGTATSGSTTTLADTSFGTLADDRMIGALLYIYQGAGAGSIRTVNAYTNATRLFGWAKPLDVAVDTTSKFTVLGAGAAAGDVINVGKIGVDLKDENTIDGNATVASEAGPLVVLAIDPAELWMHVMIRKHLFNTP